MASRRHNRDGGQGWGWFFRSPLRVLGAIVLLTCLAIFVMGREVPAEWVFLSGGLLGLDGIREQIKDRDG